MLQTIASYLVGMDIGGSHVSGARIEATGSMASGQNIVHQALDTKSNAHCIVQSIGNLVASLTGNMNGVPTIGIAMPGPFNYTDGISEVVGLGGKFHHTFGLNMTEALKTFGRLPASSEIYFANDAQCFAVGAYQHFKPDAANIICLTLGTGFGSAFLHDGVLIAQQENIPSEGAFYCEPFKDGIADDYFSTRWILNQYQQTTGKSISSVKELADLAQHNEDVQRIFSDFGENLAVFLYPWMQKFNCKTMLLGGNISKAWNLMEKGFYQVLTQYRYNIEILISDQTEQHIITGAALLAKEKSIKKSPLNKQLIRKTSQQLLPVYKEKKNGAEYDIFPSFHISEGAIEAGFTTLARKLIAQKTVILDGYIGVLWHLFRTQLHSALVAEGVQPLWYDITACLKSEKDINKMISENLNGNDPVFGKRYTGDLIDFFDKNKLSALRSDTSADMCIVYGTGAALAQWEGVLIYLDVPKNEIQYRMRGQCINNLGTTLATEGSQMYKRFYFVDWPVLNKHKQQLLPSIDIIIDEQRGLEITWMEGTDFRAALSQMLQQVIRARPWFEAGVWGGQWMKKNFQDLVQTEVNYAWSFELITPENGIILEHTNVLLEVSFDFLLYYNNKGVLGKAAERFGVDFPIRFDFLDTFDGGNLSIQCHPRTGYIKEKFGENFTQDETYYILDCDNDAKVYLGFQENIEPAVFKNTLLHAQQSGEEINIETYVQCFPASKHDLFLIPNGTIHASGKNNLVLEISSTPYIFTFKMYDWQRLDMNGQSRPINIEHAFNNLYFDRKGQYVAADLISHPHSIKTWDEGRVLKLPTHSDHFYTIDRYEFNNEVTIATNEQCHCCMLVEGEAIAVIIDDKTTLFHYAETFIIPASVNEYTVRNLTANKVYLVVAYVKEDYCTSNQETK